MNVEKHSLAINSFVMRLFDNSRFDVLFTLVMLTLFVGTIFYSSVEKWTLLDSLYFSVVTLTTVGFGDFAPQTPVGKIFTIFYLFVGIGILLGFINFITDQALKYKIRERRKEIQKNVSEKIEADVKKEIKRVKRIAKSIKKK